MREYDVLVFPVFVTMAVKEPVPTFSSIFYPVIAEPPLSDGAFHERSTCVLDTFAAERLVGGLGTVIEEVDVGVAEASFDVGPGPTEFIAEIL